jgi:protocatechuate 3,4-dioxygenase beta subunit
MEMEHEPDAWDRGLAHDLAVMMQRRQALKTLAALGAVTLLAACGKDAKGASAATTAPATTSPATTSPATTGGAAACPPVVPEETAGPYPGDGSNGPDALHDPQVVRSDITGSFGSFHGTAAGVPTTVKLTVLDSAKGCAPLAGGAVYLWHADRDGHYSMYTAPAANYLRGVGAADANGTVTFTTIWPGCYDGRWPHIHFEVYPSVADAQAGRNLLTTSQIALPEAQCQQVYAAKGYETSVVNLTHTSLATDMVFADGWDQELAAATGDNSSGWTISLTVAV